MKIQNLIIHDMLITFFVSSGFILQPNTYTGSKNTAPQQEKEKSLILKNTQKVTDHSG
jgi:hypothetical protein